MKLEHPFVLCLSAPRKAGKSTLIKKLLKGTADAKIDKPDHIVILCPSIGLNDDFKEFNSENVYKNENCNPAFLEEIMNSQKEIIKVYGKKRLPHVLIILDDVACEKIIQFGSVIDILSSRGRHMNISLIISSQRMKSISRTTRLNADYNIFFSPFNFSEVEQIVGEYVPKEKKKIMSRHMLEIYKKPYAFIFINNLTKDPTKKINNGFLEPLDFIYD